MFLYFNLNIYLNILFPQLHNVLNDSLKAQFHADKKWITMSAVCSDLGFIALFKFSNVVYLIFINIFSLMELIAID